MMEYEFTFNHYLSKPEEVESYYISDDIRQCANKRRIPQYFLIVWFFYDDNKNLDREYRCL